MPLGTGVGVKDYTRTPQDKQRGNSFLYSENRKTIWSSENSAGISDKGAQWVGAHRPSVGTAVLCSSGGQIMPSLPAWAAIPQLESGETEPSPAFQGPCNANKGPISSGPHPHGPLQMAQSSSRPWVGWHGRGSLNHG